MATIGEAAAGDGVAAHLSATLETLAALTPCLAPFHGRSDGPLPAIDAAPAVDPGTAIVEEAAVGPPAAVPEHRGRGQRHRAKKVRLVWTHREVPPHPVGCG